MYATLLGLTEPWGVEKVELKLAAGEVHIYVALPPKELWVCPECLERAPIHDHRERTWRHLDTFQYRTILHARVPRLSCPNHGVKQIRVPWAEDGSRFTSLFEALAIDWMKQASISAVATRLHLTWDEAAGIQDRAVRRGLARRKAEPVRYIGIDETSFQRGHKYVTVVSDLAKPRALYVADDRRRESLDGFWESMTPEQLRAIEGVAMDMWEPFVGAVRESIPRGAEKIVFDKFHIAKHLNDGVDQVRRREHRALLAQGNGWLKGTKYDWLRNPARFSLSEWRKFLPRARRGRLKTGRAWSLKEEFMRFWDYRYRGAADRHFKSWYAWAVRSRLEPMKKVANMIKRYYDNIATYFTLPITNAAAEGLNAAIQRVKGMARGFRNPERFRMAIYFHCGALDLYPRSCMFTQ
ncbi:MAG: ISL3 family transposase [Candidatus Eisenbacteria bacterium]|nr:ISL3 family transposase [Candidatus Eisenbacteria bacterium]